MSFQRLNPSSFVGGGWLNLRLIVEVLKAKKNTQFECYIFKYYPLLSTIHRIRDFIQNNNGSKLVKCIFTRIFKDNILLP